MDKYIITEEEQETVKLYTARSLPNNPTEKGMSPATIKKFFYKFLEPLFQVLNSHLGQIEGGITDAVEEHDGSEIAHQYILNLISDIKEIITHQGTAIENHYTEVASELSSLKENTDIPTHNNSANAHADIRQTAASALEKAINAYNLAAGKAKVYPVRDADEMISLLSDELNVGDKFVIAEAKVPDFTLFAKNYEYDNDENVDDISQENIHTYQFKIGRNYFYDGYLLVPSESGIDTSLFAKQAALSALEEVVDNLGGQHGYMVDYFNEKLLTKEDKITTRIETAEMVSLQNKTEHNLGLRTSVNLTLADTIESDFECIVNFRVGAYDTVFNADSRIIFTQDDTYGGVFTPCKNRIYEINIKNVDGTLIARVGACDYTTV